MGETPDRGLLLRATLACREALRYGCCRVARLCEVAKEAARRPGLATRRGCVPATDRQHKPQACGGLHSDRSIVHRRGEALCTEESHAGVVANASNEPDRGCFHIGGSEVRTICPV